MTETGSYFCDALFKGFFFNSHHVEAINMVPNRRHMCFMCTGTVETGRVDSLVEPRLTNAYL